MIEEKQMKSKALKVLQRLMKGALETVFQRWYEHVVANKKRQQGAEMEKLETQVPYDLFQSKC